MTYADTPRPPVGIGRERQFEIYVGGASGAFPHVPVFGERLERKARKAMTPEGYAYVAGGAGSEETIRENRAAFERWRIVPRMLRDVSVRDTEVEGWRVRDLDLAYLPFLRGKGIAQYTSDPVFLEAVQETLQTAPPSGGRVTLSAIGTLWQLAGSHPGSRMTNLRSGVARAAVKRFVETYSRPSLAWDDLAFLRERTRLPILLKGILNAVDAAAAIEHGMDGIVVSNHGGRQVDEAIATMDALPGIVEAVAGRVPILLDSGVRSGADVFRAIALGASAVGLGRPYVWGLAAGGEDGVREVIRNLRADFDLTMGLAGCAQIADIGRESVTRSALFVT